jgi:cytochrome b
MVYALSHLHAGWHAIVSIGCFVLWLLQYVGWGFYPSDSARFEAERRGRERIMESYDKYDRRDDDDA